MLKAIFLAAAFLALTMLTFSFVLWDPNPANWSVNARFTAATIAICGAAFVSLLSFME